MEVMSNKKKALEKTRKKKKTKILMRTKEKKMKKVVMRMKMRKINDYIKCLIEAPTFIETFKAV